MQTQKPILNLVSPNGNNPTLPRQNKVPAPEISFNQVLSREIAERPKTAPREAQAQAKPQAQAPTPANRTPSTAPSNTASNAPSKAPNAEGKPSNGTTANPSTDTANKSNPANANPTSKAEAGKKATDTDSTQANSLDPAKDEALAAQQSDPAAAMLALVASFNTNAPTSIAPTPIQPDATGVVAARVSLDNDPISLTPSVDNPATQAASTPEAFAKLLSTSLSGKGGNESNGGNSTPLLSEADAKAGGNITSKPSIVADLNATDPKAATKPELPASDSLAAKLTANPTAVRNLPADALTPAGAESAPPDTSTGTTVTAGQGIAVKNDITDNNIAKLQQHLGPRVGNPAWEQALGQKVVYLAGAGQQSATLTLNPPELGPLQVVLHFSNDQANASFTAAQPEVRQALEAALPKLREMMSEAGITLGNATVGTNLPNQQQSPQGEQASGQSRQNNFSRGNDNAAENAASVKITRPIHSGQGMVDTFV
jgi:flagellar hook-length control protein FliK